MSDSTRMWIEIIFNISYLVTICSLVIAMLRRMPRLPGEQRPLMRLFIWAFGLLALGDMGHVGFRVLVYALGDLEAGITLFGREVGLVGLGTLSTATTVTFFYVLVLMVWRRRFGKPYGWFGFLLFAAAALRLVIMAFPQNQWNRTVPPWGWSVARNLPLMLQGLGVAFLILRDAAARQDRIFSKIGWMIIASYTFFTPVILFVQRVPMLGMLMIPKTMAYVAIAWIGCANLFPKKTARSALLSTATDTVL
jgi:hypothetical protein